MTAVGRDAAIRRRDALLFGDLPIAEIENEDLASSAMPHADQLRYQLARGRHADALAILEALVAEPEEESRQLMQQWHAIREIGGRVPTEYSASILGVIVEVGLDHGYDILATYRDYSVHYYNYLGGGIISRRRERDSDLLIEAVLESGTAIVRRLDPWGSSRRPRPGPGHMRLNMITPVGLFFGEGPMQALERDPAARPLVRAATALMVHLTTSASNG